MIFFAEQELFLVEEAGLPWVGDGHVDERNQVVHQEQEQVVPAVTALLFQNRAENEKWLREKKKEREREWERDTSLWLISARSAIERDILIDDGKRKR